MKTSISRLIMTGLTAFALAVVALTPMTANAATDCTNGANAAKPVCQAKSGVDNTGGKGATTFEANFTIIINTILFILGAVSVLMIIIGGVRYTVSGGDSGAVTGAKNTILYAVIGLVVAMLSFAIVNFIVGQF